MFVSGLKQLTDNVSSRQRGKRLVHHNPSGLGPQRLADEDALPLPGEEM
ncbi:hypothetical protein [Bradyrhizobium icense]